jgi:hypothetical protein
MNEAVVRTGNFLPYRQPVLSSMILRCICKLCVFDLHLQTGEEAQNIVVCCFFSGFGNALRGPH